MDLIAYTDAHWAVCPDTRRSTSGYCVFFNDTLISWSAKCQSAVSRSNAEAEYRRVANVVSEGSTPKMSFPLLHIHPVTLTFNLG